MPTEEELAAQKAAEEQAAAKLAEEEAAAKAAGKAPGEGEEEEFDKDRALETIRKQREAEARALKELKEARDRLKKFEDAEKKKAEAELTELQKAQARVEELQKSLVEVQETAQALRLRQAFGSTAAKLEIRFASSQAEDDAFELADFEGVAMDESGKITGLEEAIKGLQKNRPYLFYQKDAGDGQGTPGRNGKGGSGKINKEAALGVKVNF